MFAQMRRLPLVASHANVDVIALRKHPPVTAANDCELEHHRVCEAHVVREVGLERDAVDDVAAQPECARGGAVAPVGADDDPCGDLGAVDRQAGRVYVGDLDAVSHVGAGLRGFRKQKLVEPASLRHERKRFASRAPEAPAVGQAAIQRVDDVLDNRVDREGQEPRRASGDAAAAWLVAREGRSVDEQHARACVRKTVRGGRAGGPGADDRDVERAHEPKATMARPGGVPERPKGTGCKPVGSAYGGSNPPAPTHSWLSGPGQVSDSR